MAAGASDVVVDFAHPEPDPPPVSAWRIGHIAVGIFGRRPVLRDRYLRRTERHGGR